MRNSKFAHCLVTFLDRHGNVIVHLCALFFLTAGLVYSYYLGNTLLYPDAQKYYAVAQNVAGGNGYSMDGITPTAFFTPGWPLFLALFVKLGAPIWLLRYLNFIALALCVYIIRSILRYEQSERGAPLSSLLLIGYGVLFYTAGTLYPQTLYALVLLSIVRLVIVRPFGYRQALLLGPLSALIIVIHPTGIFIPPLAVLWLFLPANWHIVRKGALSALIAMLLISIWSYRNYMVFDRFVPLTSHGGDALYIGNNPEYSISAWYNYIHTDWYKEASKLPEVEQNRYYVRKTLEFWSEQPAAALKLYLLKLADYFNFRNNLYVQNEFGHLRSLVMFVTYYPLLLCLLLRLFVFRRVPLSRTEKLFVAIYFVIALFHAVFLCRIRFRLPYDVVLIAHIGVMAQLVADRFLPSVPCVNEEGRDAA